MRILVDIGHPGHVHFFKHAIEELRRNGHEIKIAARNKDVTLALLNHYKLEHESLSEQGNGILGLAIEFIKREKALARLIRSFDPDLVTEIGGAFIAPICRLLGKPSVVFTDSEPVAVDRLLVYPFADAICTPDTFLRDIGKNQARYAGFHELAYLHPNYFRPDETVLEALDLEPDEPFTLVRFVSWSASHDVGQQGFSDDFKKESVDSLKRYGRVFVTSEAQLPDALEPYRLNLEPHQIHHALYYASLFFGDGATMATEAGILGTPSVRASSMALNMGNFVELMGRYGLVYSYYDPTEALKEALALLSRRDAKTEWKLRRNRLLAEKIDVTKYIVDTVTGFC